MDGTERRVQLIRCPKPVDQEKHIEQAELVVWATGYQTQDLKIKEADNKALNFFSKTPFTQYDIDSKCRIITSENSLLLKTFGSGLAFPLRSNDGMTGQE